LVTAAHRQGFADLQDIERAVIEPGRTIYFIGRKPSPDALQQKTLADRLDAISR
jgi:hypothetical protein